MISSQPRKGTSKEQLFDSYEPWEKWAWASGQLRACWQTWWVTGIRDLGKLPGEEIPRNSGSHLGNHLFRWEIKIARICRSQFIWSCKKFHEFWERKKQQIVVPKLLQVLRDCLAADLDHWTVSACAKNAAALYCCRTIASREEWQKSMAICSYLDKAELRKIKFLLESRFC